MKNLQEILAEIIHSKAFDECEDYSFDKEKCVLVLWEKHQNVSPQSQVLSEVIIEHIRVHAILKLDAENHSFLETSRDRETNEQTRGLIKQGRFHKKCDFLVFCADKKEKKRYILLIEMKSSTFQKVEIEDKIKNTKAFLAFLKELMKQYYDYEDLETYKVIPILFDRKKGTSGKQEQHTIEKVEMKYGYWLHKTFRNESGNCIYFQEIIK